MTEVFTEIRRTCPHCAGVGYAPRVYEHGLALDLLVDAEDCARFDGEEARRLYRLAAKYEDMAAEREHSLMPTPNAMTKLHRLNAIYLRAVADSETLSPIRRKAVRSSFVVVGEANRFRISQPLVPVT